MLRRVRDPDVESPCDHRVAERRNRWRVGVPRLGPASAQKDSEEEPYRPLRERGVGQSLMAKVGQSLVAVDNFGGQTRALRVEHGGATPCAATARTATARISSSPGKRLRWGNLELL